MIEVFDNIREDYRRARIINGGGVLNEFLHPGTQAVLVHRFGHWALKFRIPVLRLLKRLTAQAY